MRNPSSFRFEVLETDAISITLHWPYVKPNTLFRHLLLNNMHRPHSPLSQRWNGAEGEIEWREKGSTVVVVVQCTGISILRRTLDLSAKPLTESSPFVTYRCFRWHLHTMFVYAVCRVVVGCRWTYVAPAVFNWLSGIVWHCVDWWEWIEREIPWDKWRMNHSSANGLHTFVLSIRSMCFTSIIFILSI